VVVADGLGQRRDGAGIGQIAGITLRLVSAAANGFRASLDVRSGAVNEDDGRTGCREGSGDDFADLSFGTNAGEEDRGSREHERRSKNA
jgi:hypothetical protein